MIARSKLDAILGHPTSREPVKFRDISVIYNDNEEEESKISEQVSYVVINNWIRINQN